MSRLSSLLPSSNLASRSWSPIAFAALVIWRKSSSSRRKVLMVVPSKLPVNFCTSTNLTPLHHAKTASILSSKMRKANVRSLYCFCIWYRYNCVGIAQRVWSLFEFLRNGRVAVRRKSANSIANTTRLKRTCQSNKNIHNHGLKNKRRRCQLGCHVHCRIDFTQKCILIDIQTA